MISEVNQQPAQLGQATVEAYIAAGGEITYCPPEQTDPLKFKTTTVAKPAKADKLSGYERERIPKAEALGVRMNLASTNFQNVPGTGIAKIEVVEIYAALAMGGLNSVEQDLVIYFYTQDPKCRSGAWAFLMCKLADRVLAEDWGTRKRGILQAMANTALDHLVNPRDFENLSDRAWARTIGLNNHHQWKSYKRRYRNLLDEAKDVINRGDEILEQQL